MKHTFTVDSPIDLDSKLGKVAAEIVRDLDRARDEDPFGTGSKVPKFTRPEIVKITQFAAYLATQK